ncbi:MAG: molybdenum cofactor guanylyltransferase [Chloroflexota bacterium]
MISVVIQAGGQSSRMGVDKGLVPLAGRPMIEHVLARVAGLGTETLITTNNQDEYKYLGLRMASDEEPGAGALPGLRTALRAAQGDTVLVVACDMPFVNRLLLEHLLNLSGEADVVVPRWNDRYQTMQTVYARKKCLKAVDEALAQGERRMISFYPQVLVRHVPPEEIAEYDPSGRSFYNVNTPEELAEAERFLARAKGY